MINAKDLFEAYMIFGGICIAVIVVIFGVYYMVKDIFNSKNKE
jgi:hypothetical protein